MAVDKFIKKAKFERFCLEIYAKKVKFTKEPNP